MPPVGNAPAPPKPAAPAAPFPSLPGTAAARTAASDIFAPKPKLAGPPEPPHPVLKAAGFNGGIQQFNDRVQKVVQAHQDAQGRPPSPGLTLDVARSDIPDEQLPDLFAVPYSRVAARMQGVLGRFDALNPTTVRPDGVVVAHTPLTARLQSLPLAVGPLRATQPVAPATEAELQQAHPWVPAEAGFLPISNFGPLVDALSRLDKAGVTTANGQVLVGGKTLGQYKTEQDVAPGVGSGTLFAAPGSETAKQQAAAGIQRETGEQAYQVTRAVATVKQAQQALKENYPAYFAELAPDGNFNQDWVRAVARFQSSATYYRAATVQLAKDNHFGTNTAAFTRAWQTKQDKIRADPGMAAFYERVPLAFFGNGESVVNFIDGDTHGWGFLNVPTVALHTLVGGAKTVMTGVGAAVAETKAQTAAAVDFYHRVLPSYLGGRGQSLDEANAHARKVMRENPTYLRIFDPGLPAHPTGALGAIDGITNLVGDIIIGNRLVIGGAAVTAGDEAALASSRYFKASTQLAFDGMKKKGIGGVGEASKVLQGGEGLNVAVAERIKAGEMTVGQYRAHVADLYHRGQTEIPVSAEAEATHRAKTASAIRKGLDEPTQFGEPPAPAPVREELPAAPVAPQPSIIHAADTPNGAVLPSLLAKKLPNPNLRVQTMRTHLDSFDAWLRQSPAIGTNRAGDLVSSLRSAFARAAPKSDVRRIYDARTPDDLYNWTVRNIGDRELASKVRNDFVVARASEDIPAIQALNRGLIERYAAEHPLVKGVRTPLESAGPESEAEGLANVKFVSGRQKDETGWIPAVERRAQRINGALLDAARFHRQVIISGAPLPGGESLFYKHAVADTLRRWVGGGGIRFAFTIEEKAAKAEVETFFKSNPAALSDLSAQRASAEMGEVAWLTRNRPEQYLSFNTGEHLTDAKRMEGAGAYLRHLVTDDALNAFRQSTKSDRTPLFRYVWHSRFYQNLIVQSEDFKKDAAAIVESKALTPDACKGLLSDLKKGYAQDWADALYARYQAINDAGDAAGVPAAVEQAAQVAREHPGAKIDAALGKWIADNSLAFDVREAPVKGSLFDGYMQRWIGKLLTFNKLNRRTFFDKVFYGTYHDLAGAGWDRADAVVAASALAKQQTIYHMLDFSNMLQVEQNLRWLSYYATKHRLYWTWIGRTFARQPVLAAAVNDIAGLLDRKGNLNVTVGGHRLAIPAARLVWAANTEYPETSPIVETLFRTGGNIARGQSLGNAISDAFASETATSGNVITRQDQSIALAAKYLGVLTGATPATYGLAIHGMSPVQQAVFNEEMHNVILGYRADHDGRYPSEQYAVKATLLRTLGNETWRTNLFLPILPQTSRPTAIQKLIDEFGNLRDPKKRRDFLNKHPEVSDYFGASQDQQQYLHEQPLWDKFNAISKQRDLELAKVRQQIDKTGYTPETARRVKEMSAQYSQAIQRLRTQDALTWSGNAAYPAGRVADNGEIVQEGPWASKLDGDPVAAKAFLHESFPGIGQQELDAHTIGQTIVDLQNEATRIRELGWKHLGYPDEQHAKDRLSQINRTVDVFRSMPKNPTSQMIDAYYSEFVDPYMKLRDKLVAEQAKASSADKDVVFADARAIKERYDHPVKVRDPVTGKDVTFPSPVSFGFTMLPPKQYHAALAGAVSGRWQDITGYEKTLLGVKTPPNVAEGWAAYQQTVHDWRNAPANAGKSLVAMQKLSLARQVDKVYPGFYKDYLFAQKPKIDRYESTTLYQRLPMQEKVLFNEYIGGPAKQLARAIRQTKASALRMAAWRAYIRDQVTPWLAEHKQLAAEIQLYGPDFLNTLPSAG